MDLAEFLLARIDEDRIAAQAALERGSSVYDWAVLRDRKFILADANHIPRWSPARVLAECEAKRRIVEAYREERARRDAYEADDARAAEDEEQATKRRSAAARCRGLEIAVELLLLPYTAHPGYRSDWAPTAA